VRDMTVLWTTDGDSKAETRSQEEKELKIQCSRYFAVNDNSVHRADWEVTSCPV